VVPINGSAGIDRKDKTNTYKFNNLRSYLYWRMREALIDPESKIALPPDQDLSNDLVAPRFSVKSGKICVESKDDIIKRIGRSPDRADAVIYAYHHTAEAQMFMGGDWVDWNTPLRYED
jgi:hypothetical protein